MSTIGTVVRRRREAMGLSLNQLTQLAGGSPAPSFLSRIESDLSEPGVDTTLRLADALRVPGDLLLNGFGLATRQQREDAIAKLLADYTTDGPRAVQVPVVFQPSDIGARNVPHRIAYLDRHEDVFAIDLHDAPFVGEALVSRERDPQEGKGVIIEVDGRLRAGVYHTSGRRRKSVTIGTDEVEDFTLHGVIIRYTVSD